MDLNLQDKVVIITEDIYGVCNQIARTLKSERACPIIINANNLSDLNNNIKKIYNIPSKNVVIDALINIVDDDKANKYKKLLQHFYQDFDLKNILSNNFSIINLGFHSSLKIIRDSYETEVIDFDKKDAAIECFFQFKKNTVIFPKFDNFIPTSELGRVKVKSNKDSDLTKSQVANTVAFLLKEKSKQILNQIIYVDNGLHLFDNDNNFDFNIN
ncbi:hypothetical protein [uncultured Lutibacter sp.]|uniref:hypothetical protein n=1 Tax=uncultured Lutibacter sp. TaxID=437739 RepID=UPI002628C18F|nr:hypothetical protein [uncultured Lutibacter sp.]